jgi:glycosyltransferase involved in cell wall biosynthesis
MKKVILYHSCFDHFGGVETFCIAFCKRLSKYYDITFISNNLRHPNIWKIAEHCNVTTLNTEIEYKADILIFATAWGVMPNNIHAPKVIQMIHADYEAYIKGWNFTYKRHPQTTHHVCVGKNVGKKFTKVTGYKCDKVIYNLLPDLTQHPKQENEILTLITATRFSKEKGVERMLKLSQLIPIPYKWLMYGLITSDYAKNLAKQFPTEVEFKGYSNNVLPEIAKADYLVQLSDTEGMPYALLESLSQLTPVISTDYPAAKELITDGVNGYILDMQIANYKKIFDNKIKISTFEELSNENDWKRFIG